MCSFPVNLIPCPVRSIDEILFKRPNNAHIKAFDKFRIVLRRKLWLGKKLLLKRTLGLERRLLCATNVVFERMFVDAKIDRSENTCALRHVVPAFFPERFSEGSWSYQLLVLIDRAITVDVG